MKVQFTTEQYEIVPRYKKYCFGLLSKKVYDLFLGKTLLSTYDTFIEADFFKNTLESNQINLI